LKKIAIATAKGGVGKTTTAVNLGAGLALQGKNVLLIDCDPQGNIGGHFNIDSQHTLSDLLIDGHEDVIIEVRDNFDIITSGRERLYDAQRNITKDDFGIFRMNERLGFIEKYGYDYILCDLSPTDTLINRASLLFCDNVLIPVNSGIDAIMGAKRYIDLAREFSARRNKSIELFGILMNLYEGKTVLSREIDNAVREKWGEHVFKTRIRKNVSIGEARVQNKTIFEYAPASNGAKDFLALTQEVLNG